MKRLISLLLSIMFFTVACPFSHAEESGIYIRPDEPDSLSVVEEMIYEQLVSELDSDEYFVENVKAIYISQEYLEELAYNSQENVYFGYTLTELEELFQGEKYVFTLGEDNQTVAIPWEDYVDNSFDTIIRNVAIGGGIILICVTVSVVSAGLGAPAISMIFACAAKGAVKTALIYTAVSGVSAGIVRGIQTGDFNEALKAAAVSASDGFKWGAIVGSVSGGLSGYTALRGAKMNGLSMNQAARIQKDSGLPLDFIKNFHSEKEYQIYKQAALEYSKLGNKYAFIRKIDLKTKITDIYGKTLTNAERISNRLSPVDPSGIPYELHHIGQMPDSPLAILTKAEHVQGGNNKILHFRENSLVEHGTDWNKQVSDFWSNYLSKFGGI